MTSTTRHLDPRRSSRRRPDERSGVALLVVLLALFGLLVLLFT